MKLRKRWIVALKEWVEAKKGCTTYVAQKEWVEAKKGCTTYVAQKEWVVAQKGMYRSFEGWAEDQKRWIYSSSAGIGLM